MQQRRRDNNAREYGLSSVLQARDFIVDRAVQCMREPLRLCLSALNMSSLFAGRIENSAFVMMYEFNVCVQRLLQCFLRRAIH